MPPDLNKLIKKEDEEGKCSANITNIIPEHVRKYHGVKPEISGPNCWNTALVLGGVNKFLRYTHQTEIDEYLRSPMCEQIKVGETLVPGDIALIRKPEQTQSLGAREVHGLIYISPRMVYSKNGNSRESPFAIQNIFDVLKTPVYHESKPFRKWWSEHFSLDVSLHDSFKSGVYQGPGPLCNDRFYSSNCMDMFRCTPIDTYIDEYQDKISKELLKLREDVYEVECQASAIALNGVKRTMKTCIILLEMPIMRVSLSFQQSLHYLIFS